MTRRLGLLQNTAFRLGTSLGLAGLLTLGCSSKHKGEGTVGSNGRGVDPSWSTALGSCWPELGKDGFNTDDLKRNLSFPTRFRNAFPVYAAQTDDDASALLAKPVQDAPPPDTSKLTHSQSPVLSRGQAAQGTSPQGAVVQSTNGSAPPDGLCSIQTGIPQGFSK